MSCGCTKAKSNQAPDYIRVLAKNYANSNRVTVCVIHCNDWDFCTLDNIGKRKIIEIITPDEQTV